MKAIIFDTETTGLVLPSVASLDKQPRIIELGMMAVDGREILGTLSKLIYPQCEISYDITKITKITKITNADLKGQPTFSEYLPKLIEFVRGTDLLIAHNAPFDVAMLTNELKLSSCADFPWPPDSICTAQEYTPIVGFRPSLQVLYKHILGVELAQTHRALEDVEAVWAVLQKDRFFEQMGWTNAL